MANSVWQSWMCALRFPARTATKRTVRDNRRWELASELLEGRAMLSAITASAPVAAEVSHSKSFEFPNVAGTWDVEIVGIGEGTAVLTQDGKKVSSVINVDGFPEINASGKFTKKHSHSLIGKTKLNLPEVGKVVVKTNIEFPEVPEPTTFSGEAMALGQSLALVGSKQVVTGASAITGGNSKAAEFPDVSGTWELTAASETINFTDDLIITQSGKGGKHVMGMVEFEGGTAEFHGKLKPNSTELKGKATVQLTEGTAKAKFSVVFFDEFTTFTGELNAKALGEVVDLDGQKVINV